MWNIFVFSIGILMLGIIWNIFFLLLIDAFDHQLFVDQKLMFGFIWQFLQNQGFLISISIENDIQVWFYSSDVHGFWILLCWKTYMKSQLDFCVWSFCWVSSCCSLLEFFLIDCWFKNQCSISCVWFWLNSLSMVTCLTHFCRSGIWRADA
jgi:hypothetical protein